MILAPAESFIDVREIPLDELVPFAQNPRSDLGDLDGLAASIDAVGIIEPLVVAANGPHGYTVVAGHRRLAAARQVGLATVPCIHRGFASTAEMIELTTIENLQREGLSPLDEARAMQALVDLGKTQRDIAERIGCNQSHVSRRLSLTALNDDLRQAVIGGNLDLRVAERAAKLDDDVQAAIAKAGEGRTIFEWMVSDAETEVKRAAARAEGEASGLPEKIGWDNGLMLLDSRDGATHWSVRYGGELEWHGPRPAEEGDGDRETPDERSARWERENAERVAQRKAVNDHHVAEVVAIVNGDRHPSGALRVEALALDWLGQLLGDEGCPEIWVAAPDGEHGLTGVKLGVAGILEAAHSEVVRPMYSGNDEEQTGRERALALLQALDYRPHESEAEHFAGEAAPIDVRSCRECGCTDDAACDGGCSWIEADLCSACTELAPDAAEVQAEPKCTGDYPKELVEGEPWRAFQSES